jgi:prolyl-tRNA editing enzyme YbaK/EbsC (Cys-tRNA(Pro) deacylase)
MVEIHKSVAKVLETHKNELEIFECLDEYSDTQNFCDHYGFDIEDSCNAILIKAKKPEEFYAMFCVLGSTRLDVNQKAKNAMGAKRVSFASREEAEQVTNQIYGGISPLGLPDNLKIFIDKNVMNRKKLFIGAGNRISKFFLSPELLVDLTNAEVLNLT